MTERMKTDHRGAKLCFQSIHNYSTPNITETSMKYDAYVNICAHCFKLTREPVLMKDGRAMAILGVGTIAILSHIYRGVQAQSPTKVSQSTVEITISCRR